MDWDDLRVVLAVARCGSLSGAARALGTSQPTVSRRLNAFERRLGTTLFERGASGLVATSLCSGVVEALDQMEEGALAVERRIAGRDTGLQGPITVTSLDWFGDYVVAPVLAQFAQQHPMVEIELLNEGRVFNLSRSEADLAFRFFPFEQEDLYQRKVAEIGYGLYSSPAYLEKHGPPNFANGCAGHGVVTLHKAASGASHSKWLRSIAPRAQVILRANSLWSQRAVAEAGDGLVALPRVLGDSRPALRRIETPTPEPIHSIWLGVHADMRETPRIRALLDFAADELKTQSATLNPG